MKKARRDFQAGKVDFLLLSERFHVYHRYRIIGAKSVRKKQKIKFKN